MGKRETTATRRRQVDHRETEPAFLKKEEERKKEKEALYDKGKRTKYSQLAVQKTNKKLERRG